MYLAFHCCVISVTHSKRCMSCTANWYQGLPVPRWPPVMLTLLADSQPASQWFCVLGLPLGTTVMIFFPGEPESKMEISQSGLLKNAFKINTCKQVREAGLVKGIHWTIKESQQELSWSCGSSDAELLLSSSVCFTCTHVWAHTCTQVYLCS